MASRTEKGYDFFAPVYEFAEGPFEYLYFRDLRRDLLDRVYGSVLEVGVGTGRNLPFYPSDVEVTAIDFSGNMIKRARRKAVDMGISNVSFVRMDARDMGFECNSFDIVFSTFVFCACSDPVSAVEEMVRVCKPGGRVFLLEHVASGGLLANVFVSVINPFMKTFLDEDLKKRFGEELEERGFNVVKKEGVLGSHIKFIELRKF